MPAPAPPPEVSSSATAPLLVAQAGPGMLALEWEATPGCDSYRIITGDLAALVPTGGVNSITAAPLVCGISNAAAVIPEPAGSVFILVAGENAGGVGPLGDGDSGPRSAGQACP